MVIAGLLGLVATVVAIRATDQTQRVAVAASDIVAGRPVTGADVRWVDVRLTEDLVARAVRPDDLDQLSDVVATATIPAGELLSRADLRSVAAPDGKRAMSVPVEPGRAVNGDLVVGDRVDVLVARHGEVSVVVAAAEVLDVDQSGNAGLGGVGGEFAVAIAVDVRESQLLAAAIAEGELVVTRSTGAASAATAPPLTVGGLSPP